MNCCLKCFFVICVCAGLVGSHAFDAPDFIRDGFEGTAQILTQSGITISSSLTAHTSEYTTQIRYPYLFNDPAKVPFQIDQHPT